MAVQEHYAKKKAIVKVHGELTYQVDCEGHHHEVHIDQLQLQ